ncbi:MAG: hypothetical protein KBT04_03440 [Bacteroidales bacterium]|nr:hypothetical protein [Candidatus Colimorpha onthohippi]
MLPWFYATRSVIIPMEGDTTVTFADREGWWDWLFGADIIISIVAIFISIPTPWNWIYQIVSNGYFIAWIIYEWSIRKRYFQFS